jgi:hypothetical protein
MPITTERLVLLRGVGDELIHFARNDTLTHCGIGWMYEWHPQPGADIEDLLCGSCVRITEPVGDVFDEVTVPPHPRYPSADYCPTCGLSGTHWEGCNAPPPLKDPPCTDCSNTGIRYTASIEEQRSEGSPAVWICECPARWLITDNPHKTTLRRGEPEYVRLVARRNAEQERAE